MGEIRAIENLKEMTLILKGELENIAEGYISVGFYLKKTRDDELYKEGGYEDVYAFAKEVFSISRTWAIRFMQINNEYSIEGYSPEIREEYRGYGSSKLSEMLALPEEIRDLVPASATVKEIREVKEVMRETEHKYDPQMELCDVAQNLEKTGSEEELEEPENRMKMVVRQFFQKEGKECFEAFFQFEKSDLDADMEDLEAEIMSIVAPSKFRMIRTDKANVLMQAAGIRVMPYQDAPAEYSYIDFTKAFEELFFPAFPELPENAGVAYEAVYQEPLKEPKEVKPELKKPETPEKTKTEPKKEPKKKAEEKKPEPAEEEDKGQQAEPEGLDNTEPEEPEQEEPETQEKENAGETDRQAAGGMEVHEITADVVQEGIRVEEILKSGDVEKIIRLLEQEFDCPDSTWDKWLKKVVNHNEH